MTYKKFIFPFLFGFLFLLQSNVSFSQINEEFLQHLVKEDLKNEHLTYLNSVNLPADSQHYFLAKYHFLYFNQEAFLEHFTLAGEISRADTVLLTFATTKILGLPGEFREKWFTTEVPLHSFLSSYEALFKYAKQKRGAFEAPVPIALEGSFSKHQKMRKKSPLLAATLSTILPGAGKLYIGNVRTGFFTMFSMTLLGLQTWESYRLKGVEHVLTITNAGFFTGYYVTNISGSYRTTKEKKEEFKNQLLIDASTYYSSLIDHPLY